MEERKLRVLIKEPNKDPYVKEIKDELSTLQEIVGGYIEVVGMPSVKGVDMYVDEEGLLKGKDGNFWLPEYQDCIKGTCILVGYDDESGDSISLTDEQIKECTKYIKEYELPQGMSLYNDFNFLQTYMEAKFKKNEKKQQQAVM